MFNKDNTISIELHHKQGKDYTKVKLQDLWSYNSEEYNVQNTDLEEHISKLRAMYPKTQLVEFVL